MRPSHPVHPHALRDIEGGLGCAAIQKVLVVVDPTTLSHLCVEKAAQIAASFRSSVELYICEVAEDLPESWAGGARVEHYRELLRAQRLQQLEELAWPLRASGLHVTTTSELHARLEEGIAQHVIRAQPDLVVKDTHRHSLLPRAHVTSTDWALIRDVPAPLLLVRPVPWRDRPRVLACVDPFRSAERPPALDETILKTSCMIGGALGGKVEVLHVLRGVPHLPGETVPAEVNEKAHAAQRQALEQLVARICGAHVPVHFSSGPVAQGVLGFLNEHGSDIVVFGAVARFPAGSQGAGGTATLLLEHVIGDVLVVKPPGFISPLLVTSD